jgi:presenilin 1
MLAVYQKALPALPISILLGVVAYFTARFLVVPLSEALWNESLYI